MISHSVGRPGTLHQALERDTWSHLHRLAKDLPEAGVHFQDTVVYNRKKDTGSATGTWFAELLKTDPWYKDVVPNFKLLPSEDLLPGIDSATSFTSVCINTAIYLPWLVSQGLKRGVVYKRGIVKHIKEATDMHHSGKPADLIVNCTGLFSAKLGGVEDATVVPARGQIVLVRDDPKVMASISGTDDGDDEATYIMHRAAGRSMYSLELVCKRLTSSQGGGCVLGGCYQKGSWESQPDPSLAVRIMKRCVNLCPDLTDGKGIEALSIIRHGVGLRPVREGGPRVEKDRIEGINVVHQYGHGGFGKEVVSFPNAVALIADFLAQDINRHTAARLLP